MAGRPAGRPRSPRRAQRGRSGNPPPTPRHEVRERRAARATSYPSPRERVPEAGRIGAAGDEAGHLAAGRNQIVAANESPRCGREAPACPSEQHASVAPLAAHADLLVDVNRGGVLGADEETDRRRPEQQPAAEVAQRPLCIAAVPRAGIDPDLLELDGARRPRRGFGLEQDPAVLRPQPGAAVVDLRPRPPPEPFGSARSGSLPSSSSWAAAQAGTSRSRSSSIASRRPVFARLRGLVDHEDGLAGAVLARRGVVRRGPRPRALRRPPRRR